MLSNMALQAVHAGDGAATDILEVARRRVDPAARTVLAMLDCWAARGYALLGDRRRAATVSTNQADDLWLARRAGR